MEFWLKNELRDMMEDALSAESTRHRGLLSVDEVSRVKQLFWEGKIHWTQPWLLMTLELWCRETL
jgi:hypothetical protein